MRYAWPEGGCPCFGCLISGGRDARHTNRYFSSSSVGSDGSRDVQWVVASEWRVVMVFSRCCREVVCMKEEETEWKPLEQAHLVSLTAPQKPLTWRDPHPNQGKPPTCPNIRSTAVLRLSLQGPITTTARFYSRLLVSQAVAYALSFLCSAWHSFSHLQPIPAAQDLYCFSITSSRSDGECNLPRVVL